jgi:hypothetical protein
MLWPWYCQGHSMLAPFIRSMITSWLPSLLLNLYLVLVLPRVVYLLVQARAPAWRPPRGGAGAEGAGAAPPSALVGALAATLRPRIASADGIRGRAAAPPRFSGAARRRRATASA